MRLSFCIRVENMANNERVTFLCNWHGRQFCTHSKVTLLFFEPKQKVNLMFDRVKQHVREHKEAYVVGLIATGTCLIMRDIVSQSINRDVIVVAGRDAIVARKKIAMHNVSFISADRQGPPSWVVRCLETGDVFKSQRTAARELNVTPSNLSRHLNGLQDTAQGLHFERIAMAVA